MKQPLSSRSRSPRLRFGATSVLGFLASSYCLAACGSEAASPSTEVPTAAATEVDGVPTTSVPLPSSEPTIPSAATTSPATDDVNPVTMPTDAVTPTPPTSEPVATQPATDAPGPQGDGVFIVENLDRGVVAVPSGNGMYVGWRMLGYEYSATDASSVSYNLYRDAELVANVADSTNYFDASGTPGARYSVAPVIGGLEGARSAEQAPWSDVFLRVPLEPPGNTYSAHDATVADADGDGQYELFMLWQPSNSKDNSLSGVTSDVYIDALELDGTRLWRINLGPNIRAGEHYTQFIVMDVSGDGRAEMAVKTAPGTRDASGNFLSLGPAANDDDSAVYRNSDGYILTGPEYLTIFDGLTGTELATVDFDQARGTVSSWGDSYGNRVDRFLATAAYLDDSGLPSFVMARGYYTRSTLAAWNWRDGQLTQLWKFDSNVTPRDSRGEPFTGQGAHSLAVANVDDDPQEEIIGISAIS